MPQKGYKQPGSGRKKGVPNKNTKKLLQLLENEHNFFVVKKIVKLYDEIEAMYKPLVKRAIENASNNLSPMAGFNDAEVEMINAAQKNMWTILEKLLAYCYPKLRAVELNPGTDHDKIQFNIVTVSEKPDTGVR